MTAELIDQIYECAFRPELWPGMLDELALIADARGGVLLVERHGQILATSSETMQAIVDQFLDGGYFALSQRAPRAYASQIQGFVGERDFFSDEELRFDPLYRDVLLPAGLGWCAATVIAMPTGDNMIITVEREFEAGPVSSDTIAGLDDLRPHLARASLFAARLQLKQVHAATDALALLGLPCLALDDVGRIMSANELVMGNETLLLWRAQGKFALHDGAADLQLRSTIAKFSRGQTSGQRSVVVRDETGVATYIAHILPIQRSARDIFSRCSALVMFVPVAMADAPPVELIRSLFDLTPAEARVARNLTNGASLDDIARSAGLSKETIRSQVRKLLEKTGCTRQAEVVSLLAGLAKAPLN